MSLKGHQCISVVPFVPCSFWFSVTCRAALCWSSITQCMTTATLQHLVYSPRLRWFTQFWACVSLQVSCLGLCSRRSCKLLRHSSLASAVTLHSTLVQAKRKRKTKKPSRQCASPRSGGGTAQPAHGHSATACCNVWYALRHLVVRHPKD